VQVLVIDYQMLIILKKITTCPEETFQVTNQGVEAMAISKDQRIEKIQVGI
jgi:hypothetical protein